jgi:hypothetical protein
MIFATKHDSKVEIRTFTRTSLLLKLANTEYCNIHVSQYFSILSDTSFIAYCEATLLCTAGPCNCIRGTASGRQVSRNALLLRRRRQLGQRSPAVSLTDYQRLRKIVLNNVFYV